MNKLSNDEVITALSEIFNDQTYEPTQVKVLSNTDTYVRVRISRMYDAPGLSFERIQKIATVFNTKNVETNSEFSYEGCESCDYGSSYGFDLHISPGDPV